MTQIVFKFTSGFGNRLSNLMNLFYIHEQFPQAVIYADWAVNPHCGIKMEEVFDGFPFILPYDRYKKGLEKWASSTSAHDTKWDALDEWRKHPTIVSVSFHLYAFVPLEYCRRMFRLLQFTERVKERVSYKISAHGRNNIVHFRGGDLTKLLQENESAAEVRRVFEKVEKLKTDPQLRVCTYNQMTVNRRCDDVLEAISDLVYFSQHNTVAGYCPYSHFSSWIFVLSSSFNPDLPVFNYKKIDLVLVDAP